MRRRLKFGPNFARGLASKNRRIRRKAVKRLNLWVDQWLPKTMCPQVSWWEMYCEVFQSSAVT